MEHRAWGMENRNDEKMQRWNIGKLVPVNIELVSYSGSW
jgi:hypothetical protein